jgi:hypothetical protein
MSSDYADIMNRSRTELPKPKILPVGTWGLIGRNAAWIAPKDETVNGRVLFFYRAEEPFDDVSTAELEALGADYDFSINDLVHTVWIENDADWEKKVYPHLEKHEGWQQGGTVQEDLKNFRNTRITSFLSERVVTSKVTGESHVENSLSNFARAA